MASPFKQKKPPVKKDPPKKKTDAQKKQEARVLELDARDDKTKGKPRHASDTHTTNVGMKSTPVVKNDNVDKATGGPAKRAIANMIAGRTSHAKAKGALNIVAGEETDSIYS